MWNDFIAIFTSSFSWLTITLMAVGLVFCVIEAIVPGFGVWGVLGILCEIASVVVHAVFSADPAQVIILFLIITLLVLLIVLLFVRSARFGLLGKTPIVENKTAIPIDYVKQADKELAGLVGKEGITITSCKPVGKMRLNQDVYEVYSKGTMIEKGEVVKVVEIEDATIYVDKLSY